MKRARSSSHKSGSSSLVKKTRLMRPGGSTRIGAGGVRRPVTTTLNQQAVVLQNAENEQRVRMMLTGYDQETVSLLQGDECADGLDTGPSSNLNEAEDRPSDWVDEDMPVDSSFMDAMRDATELHDLKGRFYKQQRSWRPRRQQELDAWDALMHPLTDAYLEWKYRAPATRTVADLAPSSTNSHSSSPVSSGRCSPAPLTTLPPPSSPTHSIHRSNSLSSLEGSQNTEPLEQTSTASAGATPERVEPLIEWELDVYDLFSLQHSIKILRDPSSASPALDFMRHGYLTKTARSPDVAVSIKTLELLYRLRQRRASFSVEAFAKVVCDYYQIPFRPYLRSVFADTFELYLRIIREVEKRVHSALGWDGLDWRAKNVCRACSYKLEGEPLQHFSRRVCMDGNSSLKRSILFADRVAADRRVLDDSPFFLSNDYVNKFANEVRGKQSKGPTVRHRSNESEDEDDPWEDDITANTTEGDPTDGLREAAAQALREQAVAPTSDEGELDAPSTSAVPSASHSDVPRDDQTPEEQPNPIPNTGLTTRLKVLSQCVKNWKAASEDDKKRMWAIFDEAGIFACACRHGFVLWVLDMIRSGELAKYPLAIISKILDTLGDDVMIAYDIGCAMETTVKRSTLGSEFTQKKARFCVPAFHAYSHNHVCQLQFHPNNIVGMGLEDVETLERFFSGSNHLAAVVRYMSPYHRRLYIEAYLRQVDKDKHLSTGTFILSNYMQALRILEQELAAFKSLEDQGFSLADVKQWAAEEADFFSHLGEEPSHNVHAIAYVECLQRLRDLENQRSRTAVSFLNCDTDNAPNDYARELSATRKLESQRRHIHDQIDRVSTELCELEVKLGIARGNRWTPATPEYIDTLKYLHERKYQRALDKLHRLLVLRMFELSKLNVAKTGYKMRTHISKSLQVRCKTLRKAVEDHNKAAATLNPPRPTLDWNKISTYQFLEQIVLLRDTRNDLRDKRWANPGVRETIKLINRISRAREELEDLNLEVRRVHTAIRDDNELFTGTISSLDPKDPVRGALIDFATRRRRIDQQVLARIHQVYALPGYTGIRGPGVRLGFSSQSIPTSSASAKAIQLSDNVHKTAYAEEVEDDETRDMDDEARTDAGVITEFIADLALH